MSQLRAVIVGAGAIAHKHVTTILENKRTKLVGVADVQQERAEALANRASANSYPDYQEMITKERPDIVVITLPHYLHKEAAIFSAKAGCHVLLEKPMAMTAAECQDINDVVEQCGVVLAVGHMQHYFPANIEAKRITESGKLGRLVMVNDKRYGNYFREDRPAWFLQKSKAGGGVVINLGSHSIDKIQWITGKTIERVRAVLSYYGNRGDVEGSGSLFMLTKDHVPVTVSLCNYGGTPLQETELLFTEGRIKISGSHRLWISEGSDEYEEAVLEQGEDAFAAQWDDVLNAVVMGKTLSISGAYSQTISAVVDAAYLSHETELEQLIEPSAAQLKY